MGHGSVAALLLAILHVSGLTQVFILTGSGAKRLNTVSAAATCRLLSPAAEFRGKGEGREGQSAALFILWTLRPDKSRDWGQTLLLSAGELRAHAVLQQHHLLTGQ